MTVDTECLHKPLPFPFQQPIKRLEIAQGVMDRMVVVRRDAELLPGAGVLEVAHQTGVKIADPPGGIAEGVTAEEEVEIIIDELPVVSRIVAYKMRPEPRLDHGQGPLFEILESFLGRPLAVEGLPRRIGDRTELEERRVVQSRRRPVPFAVHEYQVFDGFFLWHISLNNISFPIGRLRGTIRLTACLI